MVDGCGANWIRDTPTPFIAPFLWVIFVDPNRLCDLKRLFMILAVATRIMKSD